MCGTLKFRCREESGQSLWSKDAASIRMLSFIKELDENDRIRNKMGPKLKKRWVIVKGKDLKDLTLVSSINVNRNLFFLGFRKKSNVSVFFSNFSEK
jgi:hypothetical protein